MRDFPAGPEEEAMSPWLGTAIAGGPEGGIQPAYIQPQGNEFCQESAGAQKMILFPVEPPEENALTVALGD